MNYISECTVFILIVKAHHSYDLYHMSEAFSKVDHVSVVFSVGVLFSSFFVHHFFSAVACDLFSQKGS